MKSLNLPNIGRSYFTHLVLKDVNSLDRERTVWTVAGFCPWDTGLHTSRSVHRAGIPVATAGASVAQIVV